MGRIYETNVKTFICSSLLIFRKSLSLTATKYGMLTIGPRREFNFKKFLFLT